MVDHPGPVAASAGLCHNFKELGSGARQLHGY